jgi:hypothetical protein
MLSNNYTLRRKKALT